MQYAKVGIRAVAAMIDGAMFFVFAYVIALLTGGITDEGFSLTGAPAAFAFLLYFAYFVLMEAKMGGTLGKLLLGLRVVQVESGQPISFQASLIRNVLRFVDGLFCYLVGAILIWKSAKAQRLGDRVASTTVIKQ